MEQYELPDEWMWAKVGDICALAGGGTPRRDEPRYFQGGNIPWVTPTDLDPKRIGLIGATATQITERGLSESSARLVPVGTVLFSSRASIGKIAVAAVPMATNQGFANLTPHEGINSWYLAYGLRHFTEQIKELGRGTTYREIAKSALREFHLPIAPTDEQRRIAQRIEALFEQSRTAREALDKIPELLRQFRQSVLAAAFCGDMTTRNPDDEPASELLERILEGRRRRWGDNLRAKGKDPRRYTYEEPAPPNTSDLPELPEGWCWASLEQLSWDSSYGTSQKCDYEGNGPPVLRIPNISGGEVDLSDLKFAKSSVVLDATQALQPDDLLIIRTNGSKSLIGRSALVRRRFEQPLFYASYLIRFRLISALTLPEWIATIWDTPFVRDRIEQMAATSAGQYNINVNNLNRLPLPLAPWREQQKVVSAIRTAFRRVKVVEREVDLAYHRLDNLDQSILARAFHGELVPQDLDDEPASVLLERIREERAEEQSRRQTTRSRSPRQREARKTMSVKSSNDLTRLLQELQETTSERVSPKALWLASRLEIDDFYAYLKHEVSNGRISEIREKSQDVQAIFLEAHL